MVHRRVSMKVTPGLVWKRRAGAGALLRPRAVSIQRREPAAAGSVRLPRSMGGRVLRSRTREAMLKHAEADARERGFREMALHTLTNNRARFTSASVSRSPRRSLIRN
jgi:hypothetical protein